MKKIFGNINNIFSSRNASAFRRKSVNTYTFILICIILPCLISTITLTCISAATLAKLTDTTNDYALRTMHSAANYNDNSLKLVENTAAAFALNPFVNDALSTKSDSCPPELSQALSDFAFGNKYVINAYIIDSRQMKVYSEKGLASAYDYLTEDYSYNTYDAAYWNDFAFYSAETNRVLAPCKMTHNGSEYAVIPIVFRTADSMATRKYLVTNINVKSVMRIPDYQSFGDTNFYVLNKLSNDIFSLREDDESEVTDGDFITCIKENPNGSFRYTISGEKMLVTTISENNSLIGYTYIALTPLSAVYAKVASYIVIMIIMNILCIVIIFFMSTKNAKKIYTPIKNAWLSLSSDNSVLASNMLYEIEALSTNAKLEIDRLTAVIPSAQRNYLVNMLNNVDYWNNDEANKLIEKSLNFKHRYFTVILLQLSPALDFHDRFNDSEYETIKIGFYEVVCSVFDEHFDTYVLPAENNILNIVLNHADANPYDKIKDLLRELLGYLKNDFEYITVSIGVSRAHAGITGLKGAHREAMNEFIPYTTPTSKPVINSKKNDIVFANSDETALYSALSSASKSEIERTINGYMTTYNCTETNDIKTMYNYILNTMLKFMHINNIPYKNEMLDFEIITEILSKDVIEIKQSIGYLIDKIIESRQSLANFDEIYEYIKANYSSYNISLKQLSDLFGMSQSNITRMAQANTGLSFKELLNSMRIDKAKELLRESNYSIDEICEMCGFSNQRTFYRLFKQLTGLSPAKYRLK